MGVGFVAVLPAEAADAAIGVLAARGVVAWPLGEVGPAGDLVAGVDVVQGAKGVDGGAVQLLGSYRP